MDVQHRVLQQHCQGRGGAGSEDDTVLYEYYMEHVEILPGEYLWLMEERGETKERVVCDYIAGMSDRFAIDMFEELFVPKSWKAL